MNFLGQGFQELRALETDRCDRMYYHAGCMGGTNYADYPALEPRLRIAWVVHP